MLPTSWRTLRQLRSAISYPRHGVNFAGGVGGPLPGGDAPSLVEHALSSTIPRYATAISSLSHPVSTTIHVEHVRDHPPRRVAHLRPVPAAHLAVPLRAGADPADPSPHRALNIGQRLEGLDPGPDVGRARPLQRRSHDWRSLHLRSIRDTPSWQSWARSPRAAN